MMKGARVDPGSLIALDALLSERSVTRAARRLGITQSSMSHRLAQLRAALDDELFVRSGVRLVPTPRALAMAEPLAKALEALDAAVAPPASFEPARARGSLQIVMPDLLAPLAPELVASLGERAPGISLQFVGVSGNLGEVLGGTARSLALVPARFVSGDMHARMVGDLEFGVAGRRAHPALARPLRLSQWLAYPHVVVSVGMESSNVIDEALRRAGQERRVGLVVPSFLAGLLSLTRSDLLMNVPLPLVTDAARVMRLCIRATPLSLPKLRFALAWHPRFQRDSMHQWLRERVFERVKRAFGGPG